MEAARLKRYKDKLDLLRKRKAEIEEWEGDFLGDEKTALACYKAFQEMVEAAMDILAMVLRDENTPPKDDYSNIDSALGKKVISGRLGKALKEANGLRNRVVHEYNGLDENTAYESMLGLLPFFEELAQAVGEWLGKK
ncbi:MAG: DUF86 domain-containing protein [Candidatus Micrarchaeota archaeon]